MTPELLGLRFREGVVHSEASIAPPRRLALAPEHARDLVHHFSGIRAAARAVDVPYSTLRGWLDPERERARRRARYAADRELELERVARWYRENALHKAQYDTLRRSRMTVEGAAEKRLRVERQIFRDRLPDDGGA